MRQRTGDSACFTKKPQVGGRDQRVRQTGSANAASVQQSIRRRSAAIPFPAVLGVASWGVDRRFSWVSIGMFDTPNMVSDQESRLAARRQCFPFVASPSRGGPQDSEGKGNTMRSTLPRVISVVWRMVSQPSAMLCEDMRISRLGDRPETADYATLCILSKRNCRSQTPMANDLRTCLDSGTCQWARQEL